jgi:hypothetical protein
MSGNKRQWREPIVKSIDQCQPIFGECRTGSTPAPGGEFQCNTGTGATTGGVCARGNGAQTTCTRGSGVK